MQPSCGSSVFYHVGAFVLQEIKKNMKKYNATFSLEDKMRESKASKVD